jgi:hypothetical protein
VTIVWIFCRQSSSSAFKRKLLIKPINERLPALITE